MRKNNQTPKGAQLAPKLLQGPKEKVSPQEVAEAEEEEVEEDAVASPQEPPKWTTKNPHKPLLQNLREAEAKSLNSPPLKNSKRSL